MVLSAETLFKAAPVKNVRNRTQVYPTRLSTGSTAVVKVDLLKSPIFQTTSTASGTLSLSSDIPIGKRGKPALLSVSNNLHLSEGTGIYGYFRGKFDGDPSSKPISVLGYLENRGAATGTPGYYFYALDATGYNYINDRKSFLYEENFTNWWINTLVHQQELLLLNCLQSKLTHR